MVRPLQQVLHGRCVLCEYALRRVYGVKGVKVPTLRMYLTEELNEGGAHCPLLTLDNINPRIKQMEYAVRGPLVIRAGKIEKELMAGKKKPFDEVIRANLGDAQAMGQIPITFFREVVALVTFPPLLADARFASDAKARARMILDACHGGSVGAYTDSPGLEVVRRHVAEYIERRDAGIKCSWKNIALGTGASDTIKSVLRLVLGDHKEKPRGVMVPVPQYPLYSAVIVEFGMSFMGYNLDEENNWGLCVEEMQRVYDKSVTYCDPIALVVINPGNPTGQVLSRENIKQIVKFAKRNKLILFADEVYQDNVYAEGCQFHSMKKVMTEMGPPYNKMELASFMSCSKGYMGECGMRGGYVEFFNFTTEVKAMYLKLISARLCPPVIGQTVMECIVNPPRPGDASHEQYVCEKTAVLRSLAERGNMVTDAFNGIPGMSCNMVQGAMYAFPRLRLPQKAVEKAKELNMPADTFYSFELLENTGICVVPGSGFGQKEGTYHFRTTILPQKKKLQDMLKRIRAFHETFMKKYQTNIF